MNKGLKNTLIFLSGTVLLLFLCAADVLTGGIHIGFQDTFRAIFSPDSCNPVFTDIVRGVRIPRLITAILAGSALSLAGAQMQSTFRNPLADPHIMGVSGGAGLGAAIAALTVSGAAAGHGMTIAAAAFIGAVAASAMILLVSSRVKSTSALLIFGVLLGFIFSAITSIVEYSANEDSLKIFYNWSAGSFSVTGPGEIAIIFAAIVTGAGIALANIKGLNIILFGEEFSQMAGARVRSIRLLAMTSCCIVTGAVTAFCGPIGFVGIIAPHIARWINGTSRHKTVIPASMLTGALITVCADILATAGSNPLPVGSTTAIIGIPVIIYILFRKR